MLGAFQPFLLKASVRTEKKPIFKIFRKLLHDATRKCKDQGRGEELAAEHPTTRGDDTQRLHGHSGLQERTPAPVLHGRQVYNVEVAFRKTSLFNLTPKAHQR